MRMRTGSVRRWMWFAVWMLLLVSVIEGEDGGECEGGECQVKEGVPPTPLGVEDEFGDWLFPVWKSDSNHSSPKLFNIVPIFVPELKLSTIIRRKMMSRLRVLVDKVGSMFTLGKGNSTNSCLLLKESNVIVGDLKGDELYSLSSGYLCEVRKESAQWSVSDGEVVSNEITSMSCVQQVDSSYSPSTFCGFGFADGSFVAFKVLVQWEGEAPLVADDTKSASWRALNFSLSVRLNGEASGRVSVALVPQIGWEGSVGFVGKPYYSSEVLNVGGKFAPQESRLEVAPTYRIGALQLYSRTRFLLVVLGFAGGVIRIVSLQPHFVYRNHISTGHRVISGFLLANAKDRNALKHEIAFTTDEGVGVLKLAGTSKTITKFCYSEGEIITSVAYHHRHAHVLYGGTVDGRLAVFEWKSTKCAVKMLLNVEKFSRVMVVGFVGYVAASTATKVFIFNVTSYKQQWAPEPVYSIETSSRKDCLSGDICFKTAVSSSSTEDCDKSMIYYDWVFGYCRSVFSANTCHKEVRTFATREECDANCGRECEGQELLLLPDVGPSKVLHLVAISGNGQVVCLRSDLPFIDHSSSIFAHLTRVPILLVGAAVALLYSLCRRRGGGRSFEDRVGRRGPQRLSTRQRLDDLNHKVERITRGLDRSSPERSSSLPNDAEDF